MPSCNDKTQYNELEEIRKQTSEILDRIEALENSTENQNQRIENLNEKLFNF